MEYYQVDKFKISKIFLIIVTGIFLTHVQAHSARTTPNNLRIGMNHNFTGLPINSEGWTHIPALIQSSSRIVYVSSTSGDDRTAISYNSDAFPDMLNPSSPRAYATLSAAEAQMRNGYPDIMLLKRGDTWNTNWSTWDKSGESATTPMVIAAYGPVGTQRPKTGQFRIGSVDYLVVADLELDDAERALNAEGTMSHILLEGLYCPPGPGHGMAIQNPSANGGIDYLAIRRCVIAGRYRPSGSGTYVHGFYIDDSINLLIEENIIDDNGSDQYDADNNTADIRSHNTYVMLGRSGSENHIWRYNISSRASSHGFQCGSGGTIIGNLSVQDAIGLQTTREDNWYEGFSATVKHNVILHGRDINSDTRRGWGILITNANNQTVEDNIIGDNYSSGMPYGIMARTDYRNGVQMQVRNISVKDNIVHNWNGSSVIDGELISFISGYISNVSFTGNRLHTTNSELRIMEFSDSDDVTSPANNTFYGTRTTSEWFRLDGSNYDTNGYKSLVGDATSSEGEVTPSGGYGITEYLSSVGETGTLDSFYTHLRAQRKGNWDTKYTAIPIINFVRIKFGRSPI